MHVHNFQSNHPTDSDPSVGSELMESENYREKSSPHMKDGDIVRVILTSL